MIISQLLGKKNTVKILLNRSYRSSFEINEFVKLIYPTGIDSISFPRYEEVPEFFTHDIDERLHNMLLERIAAYFEAGFETVAILCKTMKQTQKLYSILNNATKLKIIDGSGTETSKGCMIMPVYAAKGLEFDAVAVYGVDDVNYCNEMDRRLLYIACTRALHRLSLYYSGEKSRFLTETR